MASHPVATSRAWRVVREGSDEKISLNLLKFFERVLESVLDSPEWKSILCLGCFRVKSCVDVDQHHLTVFSYSSFLDTLVGPVVSLCPSQLAEEAGSRAFCFRQGPSIQTKTQDRRHGTA